MPAVPDTPAFVRAAAASIPGPSGNVLRRADGVCGPPVAEASPGGPVSQTVRHAGMVALPQHVHGEVARIAAWYF